MCGKIGLDQVDFFIRWDKQMNRYYYYTECKKCQSEKSIEYNQAHKENKKDYNKQYYRDKRSNWLDFLKELGYDTCSKCGYNKSFKAIDFHHTDQKSKEFGIGDFLSQTFNENNKRLLLEEISKCIVLCANCHREITW